MKTNLLIVVLLAVGTVWSAAESERNLIGTQIKEEEAVLKANSIVVGQFKSLGRMSADFEGEDYVRAVVQVDQSLEGTLSGQIEVSYGMAFASPGKLEQRPVMGRRCILFLKAGKSKQFFVRKLLPANDENIHRIKMLIAALPTSSAN